jgi:hypothetical protein
VVLLGVCPVVGVEKVLLQNFEKRTGTVIYGFLLASQIALTATSTYYSTTRSG